MTHGPNLSADLVALIDQEHAAVRDVLDNCPELLARLKHPGNRSAAMFGRLVALDCLLLADRPERMMYRLAAWERAAKELGG